MRIDREFQIDGAETAKAHEEKLLKMSDSGGRKICVRRIEMELSKQ